MRHIELPILAALLATSLVATEATADWPMARHDPERTAIADGDVEKATAEFRTAAKKLDQAASGKIIHANAAARTKSRLSKAVKGIQ